MKTRLVKTMCGLALTAGVLLSACSKDDDNNNTVNNNPYSISGNASGSQMVPTVSDTGTGTITGSYNPTTRMLTYTTGWSNLSGAPNGGGFYSGASGTTGTAINPAWTFDSTATGTGSRSDTITLTDSQATDLVNGNWYYSYNTTKNANGEIRGQITAAR